MDRIKPRTLKGFRDSLPRTELTKRSIQARLEKVFVSFGFSPIDTPVMEYAEILLGKGGGETDKQVYRFLDHGDRDVALRFDLTVPFARFMAQHLHELPLPFKRYHMAKVWRGENTQRGRFREFIQLDFDIVGVDSPSADLEILWLMYASFQALGVDKFRIHLFHRDLLNQFLVSLKVADPLAINILRTVDKIKKIGGAKTRELLEEQVGNDRTGQILDFIQSEATNEKTLQKVGDLIKTPIPALQRLQAVLEGLRDSGLERYFYFDPSITRGLDYYTGIVYETFLDDLPAIGSVCSGGRYNNLASLYTSTELPGVGSSIGLDRLLSALEELELVEVQPTGPQLLILFLDEQLLGFYHSLAADLRKAGIAVEVYPQQKKLNIQFDYAQKRGIPLALFCGSEERKREAYNLRDLDTRESTDGLTLDQLKHTLAERQQS